MNEKRSGLQLKNCQETQINEKYKSLSFSIILIQPEHAGNIGFIARLMRNFNFKNLIIFNPIESKEKILSHKTNGFAMHGENILSNARIITLDDHENHLLELKKLLNEFDLIIATTAKGKRSTNITRLAIFPEHLEIPTLKNSLNIAILFGRESHGLTNEEILLADIILRIPASNDYPTLNLSHSCAIILYELFKKINTITIGRGEKPVLLANREDRFFLYNIIGNLIKILKIPSHRQNNMFQAFKNIIERSIISKKEFSLIFSLFSKIESILKNLKLYEK